jgi:hypothetical protein
MVALLRANLIDPAAPNPSVEALLHAFLPHKFVDHTHSTAILSIVDQAKAAKMCASFSGSRWASCLISCPAFAARWRPPTYSTSDTTRRGPDPRQARHFHFWRNREGCL